MSSCSLVRGSESKKYRSWQKYIIIKINKRRESTVEDEARRATLQHVCIQITSIHASEPSIAQHDALERVQIQRMSIQSSELLRVLWSASRCVHRDGIYPVQASAVIKTDTYLKRAHVEDARLLFNQQNAQNKINYRYYQGSNELDADYKQFLLQFDDPYKIPL